jgi:hypothetical protein
MHLALSYMIEPTCFEESSKDEFLNKDMDEEMDQIEKHDTWELVPIPKDMSPRCRTVSDRVCW